MQVMAEESGLVGRDFAKAWNAGWSSPYIVAQVRYLASGFPPQIEMWLKACVAGFLTERHGSGWWAELPRAVRQRAEWRYRLARSEAGCAIVAPASDVRWLSFGDAIAILDSLDADARVQCLSGQLGGKGGEAEILRAVKGFRDLMLAHPSSNLPGRRAIGHLSRAVWRLFEHVRPDDYSRVLKLVAAVDRDEAARQALLHLAGGWASEAEAAVELRRIRKAFPFLPVGPVEAGAIAHGGPGLRQMIERSGSPKVRPAG